MSLLPHRLLLRPRENHNVRIQKNTYVILRRSGWSSPEELQEAAARSEKTGEDMADDIRWIRSYVMEEDSGTLGTACIYQATSPDVIRRHAEQDILYAEIDLNRVAISRRSFDVAGHYARPDIFTLHVVTKPQTPVAFD